jgi:signal transduction histidine kinase
LTGERQVGALQLFRASSLPFEEGDRKLAALLAGRAAQAILIQRAREERANASRLESIGRMLSGIVHDFKTPMAIISGYAQLAAAEEDASQRQDHTQALLRQLANVNGMVREILAFAKGERQLLARRVLVNNFVAEVERTLRAMLENTSITLDLRADYKDAARFDEIKVTRAIANVARNAIQAMPNGGRLGFYAIQTGDDLVFMISDTGPGIPREIEGRVFDSFVTHGKRDGTGLGLSIVKKIIEDHGGRVSYSSQPGQGTTFLLSLPIEGPPTS